MPPTAEGQVQENGGLPEGVSSALLAGESPEPHDPVREAGKVSEGLGNALQGLGEGPGGGYQACAGAAGRRVGGGILGE